MILITGATGNVGHHLVASLSEQSVPIRVVTRDTQKFVQRIGAVERIVGDLRDAETVRAAVDGVSAVFLLPMFGDTDQTLITTAAKAGVGRIVMVSTIAPDDTIIGAKHRETEGALQQSGLTWGILRSGAFMSNALMWAMSIRMKGVVYTPIADSALVPISPQDIAIAAETLLLKKSFRDDLLELTGAEILSTRTQVEILSCEIGKPIQCVELSVEQMASSMAGHGSPTWMIEGIQQQMNRIRQGRDALVTHQFKKLTGKEPETFQHWCTKNKQFFL